MVLRVDLEDFKGSRRYAEFDEFLVRSKRELYKMSYKTYKDDAGNSLAVHNNMMFSAYDKDNDKNSGSCAQNHKGEWWYNSCHRYNLNALEDVGQRYILLTGIEGPHIFGGSFPLSLIELLKIISTTARRNAEDLQGLYSAHYPTFYSQMSYT
ncbi:techylectin-5B-like [Tachypleus tridentatus]|uniref:techylectin-5B-like n=1 Tax=Tachypleus tridentatus TaxID=6853 RepID=UPI003FD6631C